MSNLIATQELGKPRPKVIPKPILTIVERMKKLQEERKAREEKKSRKEKAESFDALELLNKVE